MKTKIARIVLSGSAAAGLLLCGNARAQIALKDGSIYSTSGVSAASTVSLAFEVSQGASVMVAAVYDNNNNTGIQGPDLVWSNTTSGITQPFTAAIVTNPNGYVWTWAVMYYLMGPLPGPGVVIGTDPGFSPPAAMFMEVYTLSGVDTNTAPAGYGIGNNGITTLSVGTSAATLAGSWAAVMSVNYNGGGGNNVTIKATTGGVLASNFRPNGLQCTMGYVTNLAAGVTTIKATGTGVATLMDLAAEVFSPLIVVTAPTNVVATGQTDQIRLTWDDSSGGRATGYIVLRTTTSGSGYSAIATNTGNASTTYTDTSVINLQPYYYVVQAVGPGGVSVYSAEVSAYAVGLPPAPAGLTANGDINQVDVSWASQLGVTSYNVLRSTTSGSGFTLIGSAATNALTDTLVSDGTLYYYEVNAANGSGTGPNSSPVGAVPVVAFLTNWIGVFNSDSDTNGWTILNGSPTLYFYPDPPPSGPSTNGCLTMDAFFGAGITNDFNGIAEYFSPPLNVSTYQNIELDIVNQSGWDQYNKVQAVQLNLQVPDTNGPTFQTGTWPDIVLDNGPAGTGFTWTHYAAPLADWDAYDLTSVTAFGINVLDFNYISVTEVFPSYANIAFTGAPAWPSAFSVASQTIASGSTSVTLTGAVSGTVAGTNLFLAANTPITVTINGSTQTTAIGDSTGDFTVNFNTTGFGDGIYHVTYAAPADMVALLGATNSSTTLTLSAIPAAPTILSPSRDATGTNLAVRVATQTGYNYYLLSTTSLAPPVVWTTNSATAGTGGVITNLVPITEKERAVFLRYLVQ